MGSALILGAGLWFLIGMWPTFYLCAQRASFVPIVTWAIIGTALLMGGVAWAP